jgi:multiple sugar transport system permease protein
VLFVLVLATLMVPYQVTIIPQFVIVRHMPLFGGNDLFGQGGIGWINSYWGLIVPGAVGAFGIFLLRQFFMTVPRELEEAARIDGATPWQAFRKVILPLAAPGLFTTAILAFISAWNEFLLASQLSSDRTQPVTVAIASFAGAQPHQEPYTTIMAAGTIVTVPLVLLVLVFQRQIVSGLTAGGVKG